MNNLLAYSYSNNPEFKFSTISSKQNTANCICFINYFINTCLKNHSIINEQDFEKLKQQFLEHSKLYKVLNINFKLEDRFNSHTINILQIAIICSDFAVDDLLCHLGDNHFIGLILSRSKVVVLAEYALRNMFKPVGLAEYRLEDLLAENLKTAFPTIEKLGCVLAKYLNDEGKKMNNLKSRIMSFFIDTEC